MGSSCPIGVLLTSVGRVTGEAEVSIGVFSERDASMAVLSLDVVKLTGTEREEL